MSKVDANLGKNVHQYLIEKGVETPASFDTLQDRAGAIGIIRDSFTDIMKVLGLNLSDDSLTDTPNRVAKMFVDELFIGLDYANFPKCTTVENKFEADEMVSVSNIQSMSVCEHHFVTIDGIATVAYIPNKRVLGLSKINRIVNFFSRRPQVQERLTGQIFHALQYILETEHVAVHLNATHYCVKARGVMDNSRTSTIKLGGQFRDNESTKAEFLSTVKNG